MKIVLPLSVIALAAWFWNALRTTTLSLQAEFALAHERQRVVESLRAELDRLKQRAPTPEDWVQLRRSTEECDQLIRQLAARPAPAATPAPTTLSTGGWLPVAAWKNRGHDTPVAALETTLWAAAGGDVSRLGRLLLMDAPVLSQATTLFARLPDSARTLYATPEQLIAAVTAKAIPLGEAQLVWQQSSGPDDANACLFLRDPRNAGESGGASKSIVLALRRTDEGWRLVVPASAITRLSRELTKL